MPIGLLRDTSSGLISPQLAKEPTSANRQCKEDLKAGKDTTTGLKAATPEGDAAARFLPDFPPTIPLAQARTSQSSICSEACAPSWGTASQLCADDLFGSGSLSTTTSAGGSSSGGAGYSAGGSSLHGLAPFHGGDLSHSHCRSGYSEDGSTGAFIRRRVPTYASSSAATPKHTRYLRKSSLGAVAEQLDRSMPPCVEDEEAPWLPSQGTETAPAAHDPLLLPTNPAAPRSSPSDQVSSLWVDGEKAHEREGNVCSPNTATAQFPSTSKPLELSQSSGTREEPAGRVGAMVALFDDAVQKSRAVSFEVSAKSPLLGPPGLEHDKQSPMMGGCVRCSPHRQPTATRSVGLRNSRSTPSAWGPVHTQQWYGGTFNDVAGAATVATTSSRSSQALNDLLAQPLRRQQRQTDSSSRQAACTGAAAAPTIKYIPPHVSPHLSTSARPHTRLAATHRNASQQTKHNSGPALSPLAARPPFNPYGKAPAKTTATVASMPNGPHSSSSTPLAALHTTASASGAASAGRRSGPQLPRLIVQHSAPASINSTAATHAFDQGRRPPNPAPINTTTSSRPHITQAAGPVTVTAGPQKSRTTSSGSGRNSNNSKAARPPSNPAISTFSALSPCGKKILNTATTTAARAADAAAIVAPASGLAHGYAWDQLRHPVCRYSVDSVCSDRFPTDRQVTSPPPSEPQPEMTVSPLPRSQQRLFTIRPSTSPTPTGLCSPAETLPLLRSPYVPSLVQALDNPGQRLPQPTLLHGLEDIVPMASPVSAAIYGAGANACEAGPRAAAGVRERRRRIDDHWSWAVPDSVQSAYTLQSDVLTVKPRAGRNTRRAPRDSSSGTDASDMDDFGLPAWAWRSVAVLLSQSVDASISHREREQSPLLRPPDQAAGATPEQPSETGRPAHLLPNYSPNDPLMVPLRRLTGTPLRKRSDDPSTAVQASILHLTRPATAATSGRPRYCQELTYLEAGIDSFSVEEVTTVLLSRQQARCRYSLDSLNGRSSLSIHAGEAAAVAAPSSHASSDSDEPSNPLPIPSDEVAGWMEHTSEPLPSSGARLLPFSGAHIDAMVLESLRRSCAGLAKPTQRRPTFAKKVRAAAEADMEHALQHNQRAGKSVADDAETFLAVEAEISPQLLYPTSISESVDDSDEQEHPGVSPRGLATTDISSGLLHHLDLGVIISNGRRECQELELSSALTVLWAVPAFLSSSRPGPGSGGSCAAHADWGAAWAAAICVAGTLAALTVEMAPSFICFYATAAMAAAGLMVAMQTGARCFRRHRSRSQQALATTAMQPIPLSGLGAGLTPRGPVLSSVDGLKVSPVSIRVAASEDQPCLNQSQDGITCYSVSSICTKASGGASEDGALRTATATATAQRNEPLPGSCPPSQANNLTTPDATAGRLGDTDVDTDGGMLAIASGAISTFTQAISAMRASGCERAALRWMARACGVYAGMQMAAAARSDGSVLPDATSADWEAMRGLVQQCLSKPQQLTTAPDFAEAVEVPLNANSADANVTSAVSCCLVPAADQPLSSCGGLLVDGEHQRCEAQATLMDAHLRAATLPATFLSTEPTRSSLVLKPSLAGELPGPPINLGVTSSEVASADVAVDVWSHGDHLTLVSRSSGSTHSPSSFPERHEQELATPAMEITAFSLDATTKQINEESALTTLAEAQCLFTPLSGAIPNPAFAAGANHCMLSTDDSLALEALAPQCCTRQFAYGIAEAMCSPISTWEALEGSAGLATRREEVLAACGTMFAEEARLSVFAGGAQDVACLELWEARGAREGAAFTVEEAALCAANKEEDAMGVLVKEREQQLQQVARAAAAHDAVEMNGESGRVSASDSPREQQQQLVQRCIALEKEASAATTIQAENGGEVAVKAHIAGRWELLALVLYADGSNVTDCIHGSAALEEAVQDLFRQRALQLQAVADVAAVDSAITVSAMDLEEAACRTCAEVQQSWLLGAAAAEAAADSRNALLGLMAEEAALVRLARLREVLTGICFAVEAMEAAATLRACDMEEASLKSLAKRRARCMASHGGIVANAAKTAVAAAAAEDVALEQLAVAHAQHLVAPATVVADDIRAVVSAANAEDAGLEQVQQECEELVARQGESDAAIAAIAVQAAVGEKLAVQALAAELYVVDTAVGTVDLCAEMTATAGQALIACGLVYMQLRKQQLFMHATFLGCMILAALVAASSVSSLYCNGAPARSRRSRRGHVKARSGSKPLPSEVLAGFWPGAVSPLRGFPLRSLGEECSDGDASHGGGEVAANEVCGVAPASFPVFLGDEASETPGSSNGGEEQQ